MPRIVHILACSYLLLVSLVAVLVTVVDKRAAESGLYRVSENALLLVSLLGGSLAMYVTMRAVRHKTRHAKFMLGIPMMIVVQVVVAVLAFFVARGFA
ncbi:MAG: DUF1294 domain-containing protein [Coriobacteriia bacterium]|nr:DUF1294 domain-containing protein [Coriobacteriia bacterium]